MEEKNKTAMLQMISSMTIYGTLGLLRRYLPIPSALIALVRGIIGALFLLAIMMIQKKRINWHIIRSNLFWLILSGGALGFDWILLFETYRFSTVAAATLCYYTAPAMVILASVVLFREKLTFHKGICTAVSLAGMVFASGILQPDGIMGTRAIGVILGLSAAVLYAAVILINRKLRHVDAYSRAVVQLAIASLLLIPYNVMTVDFNGVTLTASTVCLLLVAGVVHTGVAYALYFSAMASLPAQSVALMSYVDPIVSVLLSVIVLREDFGFNTILGAAMVLGSMAISELKISHLPQIRYTIWISLLRKKPKHLLH